MPKTLGADCNLSIWTKFSGQMVEVHPTVKKSDLTLFRIHARTHPWFLFQVRPQAIVDCSYVQSQDCRGSMVSGQNPSQSPIHGSSPGWTTDE
jgi:hypothetical protein